MGNYDRGELHDGRLRPGRIHEMRVTVHVQKDDAGQLRQHPVAVVGRQALQSAHEAAQVEPVPIEGLHADGHF